MNTSHDTSRDPQPGPDPDLDPGLDPDREARDRLADAISAEAVFSGFSHAALNAAGERLGLPRGEAGADRVVGAGGGVGFVAVAVRG